jgi:hypothetical protein
MAQFGVFAQASRCRFFFWIGFASRVRGYCPVASTPRGARARAACECVSGTGAGATNARALAHILLLPRRLAIRMPGGGAPVLLPAGVVWTGSARVLASGRKRIGPKAIRQHRYALAFCRESVMSFRSLSSVSTYVSVPSYFVGIWMIPSILRLRIRPPSLQSDSGSGRLDGCRAWHSMGSRHRRRSICHGRPCVSWRGMPAWLCKARLCCFSAPRVWP